MEYKSDMDVAIHALQDEMDGVKWYKWTIENCKDPELVAAAQKILADEKQHASIWLSWINKHAQNEMK